LIIDEVMAKNELGSFFISARVGQTRQC